MTPDDRDLDRLLDSVAGGEPVDWSRAEAGAGTDADRAQLRALKDLERVAVFHRGLQREVLPGGNGVEPTRWGDLLLLERVGAGSSGEVHRAWDPALQREVAVKLLKPRPGASTADLLEEARAMARVRHANVVAVHGAREHDGRVGLWMEFLDGETLEQALARRGALPAAEVARLGLALAHALAAVHAAGALHRDVKPANVLIARDGRAVLMDFGLGQRSGAGRPEPGPFSGTPMFMSPQRLAGAPATAADDVYALGATLRSALTGAPPFAVRTLEALREAAAVGPPESLERRCPDAPPALIAAIERAMAPRPSERTPSAAKLASALEAAEDGRVVAPGRRSVSRGPLVLGALALVVIAALAIPRARRAPAPSPAPEIAPAPAVAQAAAYDVSATFLRRARDGAAAPLGSGDRVAPGDRLSLEFHATRPMWVYVLDADDRGETYLLFPQPLFDRGNPVAADSLHVLPGTRGGVEIAWTVTSRGGREHLLVVANPERVPELEAELARLPAPVPGRPIAYARVAPATVDRLRGVGGVDEVPAAPAPAGPAAAFQRVRALAGSERGVRGTWMRQITLENPLR